MGNRRSGIAGGRNHPPPPLSPQQFWASYTMELLQWLDWGHPDLEIHRSGHAEG